jgi:4-hydroxybenzoate polyprenyltransferase
MPYLKLMRPHQWVKNVFIFAGVVFGRKLDDPAALGVTIIGFFCLSLVSSAVYIVNDLRDLNEDRLHPRKRFRPLAAGTARPGPAGVLAVVCALIGLVGAFLLDVNAPALLGMPALVAGVLPLGRPFFWVALIYLALQVAYTFSLKRMALLDVIVIAIGFVLRAVAGAVLVEVEISIWLVLCTFTLCLFMGFSKRRCELDTLAANASNGAGEHRRTLLYYTPAMLSQMTTVSAGIAVIGYMLYATDDITVEKFGTPYLAYTVPLVVYAVFRFTLLVETQRVDGPTDVMLRDRPFQIALLVWVAAALAVIYYGPQMQALFSDA